MPTPIEQLEQWMQEPEGENQEFKSAWNRAASTYGENVAGLAGTRESTPMSEADPMRFYERKSASPSATKNGAVDVTDCGDSLSVPDSMNLYETHGISMTVSLVAVSSLDRASNLSGCTPVFLPLFAV